MSNKKNKRDTMTIDLEPTYIEILKISRETNSPAWFKEVEKACRVMDYLRQAQKRGEKKVTVYFENGGSMMMVDGSEE